MMSIVVADRSFFSEALRSARRVVPDAVRRLISGREHSVAIGDAPTDERYRPFRQVEVVVAPEMILQRRVVVPAKARKDIVHAINLLVQTETPFAPEEVVVHALEDIRRPSDQQVAYTVRLLPRIAFWRAMGMHKLRARQIGSVIPHGVSDVDFAPALLPARRYTRWLPAVPVALALASAAAIGFGDLSQRQLMIAELEREVAATLGRVKTLADGIDTARQQASGTAMVLKLLTDTPSALVTLETVRRFLPAETELLRIDLRGPEARLAVRSTNALADAQSLSVDATRWSGSIEGPITTDPSSNLELATILLRPRVMDSM